MRAAASPAGGGAESVLYYGDNLGILREHIKDESVDLIYLDPPFNSNINYNVIFSGKGNDAPAQARAFDDTWTWTFQSDEIHKELMKTRISGVIDGLMTVVGTGDLMAYLVMMSIRLLELHRVLKPTGSLYLHCDPTASHYIKVVLDAIFGPQNFRNEIIWKRTSAHSDARQGKTQYGRIHDTLLFYTKTDDYHLNRLHVAYDEKYVKKQYKHVEKDTGRRYGLGDLLGPGGDAKGNPSYEVMGITRHWRLSKDRMAELIRNGRVVQTKPGNVPRQKRYLDEMPGIQLQDIWTDINPLSSQSRMRKDYPTQKPPSLLERIIESSSKEGDVILDPFCGCGTTVIAAEKLRRKWIGIDITYLAVDIIETDLREKFDMKPEVVGRPHSVDDARKLAEADKFQFELWAISRIPGLHPNERQVGDKGVDGRGHIMVGSDKDGSSKYEKVIASVKGGKTVNPGMVRDLVGTVQSEGAAFGIFICLKGPTKKMEEAAVAGGSYETPLGSKYQRVQIYTIEDYFDGRTPNIPGLTDGMNVPRPKRTRRGRQSTF